MTAQHWSQSLSVSMDEHYEHSFLMLGLIGFSTMTYLASLVANILFATGTSLFGLKLFHFPTDANVLYEFDSKLAPSKFVMYLWVLIFAYQLAWIVYGMSTIFRKSSSDYLYKYPPVMHWLVYLNFSASNFLYIVSLVFWSRGLFIFATVYSFLTVIGLYISACVSLFKLSDYQREMYFTEKSKDVWCIRMLVQNGIFLYATWSFVIFLLMLNLCLISSFGVSKEMAHLVVFIVLLIKLIIYFIAELFFGYNYAKFLFTPWLVIAIFLLDTLINQSVHHNMSLYERVSPFKSQHLSQTFSFTRLDINSFIHYIVTVFYLFLFVAKLAKFVYKEFFYTKKFSHYF